MPAAPQTDAAQAAAAPPDPPDPPDPPPAQPHAPPPSQAPTQPLSQAPPAGAADRRRCPAADAGCRRTFAVGEPHSEIISHMRQRCTSCAAMRSQGTEAAIADPCQWPPSKEALEATLDALDATLCPSGCGKMYSIRGIRRHTCRGNRGPSVPTTPLSSCDPPAGPRATASEPPARPTRPPATSARAPPATNPSQAAQPAQPAPRARRTLNLVPVPSSTRPAEVPGRARPRAGQAGSAEPQPSQGSQPVAAPEPQPSQGSQPEDDQRRDAPAPRRHDLASDPLASLEESDITMEMLDKHTEAYADCVFAAGRPRAMLRIPVPCRPHLVAALRAPLRAYASAKPEDVKKKTLSVLVLLHRAHLAVREAKRGGGKGRRTRETLRRICSAGSVDLIEDPTLAQNPAEASENNTTNDEATQRTGPTATAAGPEATSPETNQRPDSSTGAGEPELTDLQNQAGQHHQHAARTQLEGRGQRVHAAMAAGLVSKAARMVQPTAMADTTNPATLRVADSKFPRQQPGDSVPELDEDDRPQRLVDRAAVEAAARKLTGGKSPGPSLLRVEFLLHLLTDQTCAAGLVALVQDIVNGTTPDTVREALKTSRLVLLDKKNGADVRPVALGESIVKVAERVVVDDAQVRKTLLSTFEARLRPCSEEAQHDAGESQYSQYGVLSRGGAAKAAAVVQAQIEVGEAKLRTLAARGQIDLASVVGVLKVDKANAFNTVRRKKILEELRKRPNLQTVWPIAQWCLETPGHLLLSRTNETAYPIKSEEGVDQGAVLSPAYFALACHSYTERVVAQAGPHVRGVGVADDDTFVGPLNELAPLYHELMASSKAVTGCGLSAAKTELMIPGELTLQGAFSDASAMEEWKASVADQFNIKPEAVVYNAMPLLGTVVGVEELHMCDPVANFCNTHPNEYYPGYQADEEQAASALKPGPEDTRVSALLDEKLASWARKQEQYLDDLERLPGLPVQDKLLILRVVVAQRPTYLLRTVPPAHGLQYMDLFDQLVQQAFRAIIGIQCTSEYLRDLSAATSMTTQVSLPVKFGGFGLRSAAATAPRAFLAHAADSHPACRAAREATEAMLQRHNLNPGGVGNETLFRAYEAASMTVHRGDNKTEDLFGDGAIVALKPTTDMLEGALANRYKNAINAKLQAHLTHKAEERTKTSVLERLQKADQRPAPLAGGEDSLFYRRHVARLASTWKPGASRLWTLQPTLQRYELTDYETIVNAMVRLGVPLSGAQLSLARYRRRLAGSAPEALPTDPASVGQTCPCRKNLSLLHYPSHILACQVGAGMIVRHDAVKYALAEMIRLANVQVGVEPNTLNAGVRPDLEIHHEDKIIWVDIRVSMPDNDRSAGAGRTVHDMLKQAENAKISKYRRTVNEMEADYKAKGITFSFVPFIMLTTGAMGPRASKLLDVLDTFARSANEYFAKTDDFKPATKSAIAVGLARGVARNLTRTMQAVATQARVR